MIARPLWGAYQVEEIEIDGDPSRWLVHYIKIGNKPQQHERYFKLPVPGERFCKGGIMRDLRLEVCQTSMDFVLAVEYVGARAAGEVFKATLVGTAV